jgi:uncharacterized membrane protein YgcG
MKRRHLLSLLLACAVACNPAGAQTTSDKAFKPEELDQILAPIALYPDSLLSQILMAAGYPLEIVEAARWAKSNPNLKGDAAVQAVKDKSWDTSVKSLVAFPDVLNNLNQHLDWAQKLGDAMIGQQADVADAIQRLRAKASAAGNLQSTPQQTVTTEGSGDGTQYVIQPASADVVYVPQYSPSWAYGSWPYPAYPPVYYPLAGALARGFFWGAGVAAAGALFGGWNWGGRGNSYVNVNVNRAVNIDNHFDRNRFDRDGGRWQHDPGHRHGVGYRDNATRERFNQRPHPGADQRAQFRGRLEAHNPASHPNLANRPGAGGAGTRHIPTQHPNLNHGIGQRPTAFGGVNRGQQINHQATRGRQQMNRAQSHPNFQARGGGNFHGGGGGNFHGGGGGNFHGGGGGGLHGGRR